MKVFIAHKKTGLFWTAQKTWISGMDTAHDFGRVIPAKVCCEIEKLKDVELVLIFPGTETALRVDTLMQTTLKAGGLNALLAASLAWASVPALSSGLAACGGRIGELFGAWLTLAAQMV